MSRSVAFVPAARAPPSDAGPLTEQVAPVFLKVVLAAAQRLGIGSTSLFRGLGFTANDLETPGFRVAHFEAATFIRRTLEVIGNPALGLELGMQSNIATRGALALGLLASATLGEAVRLMLRFTAIAGLLVALTEETSPEEQALLATPLFDNHDIEPILVGKLFTGLVRMCRQGSSADYVPIAVELVRLPPADVKPYETYFRCPVRFGAPLNRLVSDAGWMGVKLRTADAMSFRYAEELLLGEAAQAGDSALGLTIARAIPQTLQQSTTTAELASSLHLSERTLRRRLRESGLSHRKIQDEERKSRALALVMNGTMELSAVALETRFADVGNFRRAFKRWTGRTPTEMRSKS
jgi:AraC-like DNA-binding protein